MKNIFVELLENYESIRPRRGQIIQGRVLERSEESVILDVGAKRDAIVPPKELARLDESTLGSIEIGDQLPVFITNSSSQKEELLVSIEKGLEQRDWNLAEILRDKHELLNLIISGYNNGGVLVEFGKLKGFVPNSLIPALLKGLNKQEKQLAKQKMVGTYLPVKVIEVDQRQKRFVLSARAAENDRRKQRLQELCEGETITGTVSNVVDFGVFVDLNGVDGLIHISKLSWSRVNHPSDVLHPGDEVEVLIKSVDIEGERVSLDRRALLPGPWEQFASQYHRGDILEGTVEALNDFGAFVKLTNDITGLVHVSQFDPWNFEVHPGEKVQVMITEIDTVRERVGLSMRSLVANEII